MADPTETAEALDVARDAAGAAGTILRAMLDSTDRSRATEKRPGDLVTAADRAAEAAILQRIERAFPEHAVLAEESGTRRESERWRWIIDPLDGTTNFVHSLPMFAVSIALADRGDVVVGVVLDVVRNEWFTARAGEGAWVDLGQPAEARRLVVSAPIETSGAIVATGFPFRWPEHVDRYMDAFRVVFDAVADMRRAGSAALDLAYVAAGRVDGFWELGLNVWDIAAGDVLVREAGGRVTDWRGRPEHLSSGWIVAGGERVHGALLGALEPFA